jgi:CubicO group peptidase (beta-lactamase class C family)
VTRLNEAAGICGGRGGSVSALNRKKAGAAALMCCGSRCGASSTWRWHDYDNAWIDLDGRKMQSMIGGGHWGGGMFISARDMARFGYLFLRNGRWRDRELVASKWIQMARTPAPRTRTLAT